MSRHELAPLGFSRQFLYIGLEVLPQFRILQPSTREDDLRTWVMHHNHSRGTPYHEYEYDRETAEQMEALGEG